MKTSVLVVQAGVWLRRSGDGHQHRPMGLASQERLRGIYAFVQSRIVVKSLSLLT